MRTFLSKIFFILLLQLLPSCNSEDQPLSIGYWNVENLFDTVDDPNTNDDEFSIGGKKNITKDTYQLTDKYP